MAEILASTQGELKQGDVIKGLQALAGIAADIPGSLADAKGDGKVEVRDVLENLRIWLEWTNQ